MNISHNSHTVYLLNRNELCVLIWPTDDNAFDMRQKKVEGISQNKIFFFFYTKNIIKKLFRFDW